MGVGIVHHVAWRAPDDKAQLDVREKLVTGGVHVTPVIDRNYFNSIYFTEPGGVIFEVATDPPGFMIDETKETLGAGLKLPKQFESHRAELERVLPEIHFPAKQ
jgi:glyoxalase family protein